MSIVLSCIFVSIVVNLYYSKYLNMKKVEAVLASLEGNHWKSDEARIQEILDNHYHKTLQPHKTVDMISSTGSIIHINLFPTDDRGRPIYNR